MGWSGFIMLLSGAVLGTLFGMFMVVCLSVYRLRQRTAKHEQSQFLRPPWTIRGKPGGKSGGPK